jgi:hypothetical protein
VGIFLDVEFNLAVCEVDLPARGSEDLDAARRFVVSSLLRLLRTLVSGSSRPQTVEHTY